jgi:hypothetical protein
MPVCKLLHSGIYRTNLKQLPAIEGPTVVGTALSAKSRQLTNNP